MRRFFQGQAGVLVLVVLLVLVPGHGLSGQQADPGITITARPWEEVQRLFRSDPRWLGGDGASSVDLGGGRVLWLFGDSFIDPAGTGSRRNASFVRNSAALQEGYEPETARMTFAWKTLGNRPRSFFREDGAEWFWPGSGARIRDVLLIFLVRVRAADNGLGFEPSGWKVVSVPNPDASPFSWGMWEPGTPRTGSILPGSSSVVVFDGFLYAFGTDWKDNAVYALRWPLEDVSAGDLSHPQWWMGTGPQWVGARAPNRKPVPVFTGGQVEFTVHYEPVLKGIIQVQTLSLADPCLAFRFTGDLSAPWSDALCFYQPPERTARGLLIYAGRAHKVFQGADVAFTYAVNTLDPDRIRDDMDIYYPVVLKGTMGTPPPSGSGPRAEPAQGLPGR